MANAKTGWNHILVDGAGNRLVCHLEKRKDGTWRTLVHHTVGKGKAAKRTRGATTTHRDEKAARAAWGKLATDAKKQGWKGSPRAGFAGRPDAFDAAHLPAPKGGRK